MAGMQDVVTAVGKDHLFAGLLPFQALIDQPFTSEDCAQAPILTCRLRWPSAGSAGPVLEDVKNGYKLLRITLPAKLVLFDLAHQPVTFGALLLNRGHHSAVELGAGQIDGNHPAGRVERLYGHAANALPLAVGLRLKPGLEEFDRVHGS